MTFADVLRTGSLGLRVRRTRAALSALGIAIGVASMVAVLGISESSKADLLAQLDTLGTNLLRVAPGQSFLGEDAVLPESAGPILRGADGIEEVAATEAISGRTVRRSPYIDENETGGIGVVAADPSLLTTTGGPRAHGRFLAAATARSPTVVLGADAATRLGIDDVGGRVWITDRWFTVIGILDPVTLADSLDSAALIGFDAAVSLYGVDRNASTVYVRTDPDRVESVRDAIGRTANPEHPEEVDVSRPSDALEATAAAKTAFASLFLGLGAVALLVGGVGIANVMVISVLERRSEIGLRRALGATRRHIAVQFLTESVLLGAMGGAAGAVIGVLVTAGYDTNRGWALSMPAYAIVGALASAVIIGALAGAYPALRGARVSPTTALRTA